MKAKMKTAALLLVVAGTLTAGAVEAFGFSQPSRGCYYSPSCHYGRMATGPCCNYD